MPRVARAVFAERVQALRDNLIDLAAQHPYRGGSQPLPAEGELGRSSGLSRNSVRRVIADLIHEGTLTRLPHRGVFAAEAAEAATRRSKGPKAQTSVRLRLALYNTATFRARLNKLSR